MFYLWILSINGNTDYSGEYDGENYTKQEAIEMKERLAWTDPELNIIILKREES